LLNYCYTNKTDGINYKLVLLQVHHLKRKIIQIHRMSFLIMT